MTSSTLIPRFIKSRNFIPAANGAEPLRRIQLILAFSSKLRPSEGRACCPADRRIASTPARTISNDKYSATFFISDMLLHASHLGKCSPVQVGPPEGPALKLWLYVLVGP